MYGGTQSQSQVFVFRPTKDSPLPHPQSLHLYTGWSCSDKGDSADGPQDKACLHQRWEDGCMPGSDRTARGMHHRETMAPKGSRLHPLHQGDRIIVCLGRPRRSSVSEPTLGFLGQGHRPHGNITPGHVVGLGQASI